MFKSQLTRTAALTHTALLLSSLAPLAHAADTPATRSTAPARPSAPRTVVGGQVNGGVLVSNHQILTPLGKTFRVEGARPKDLALAPDGATVAVLAQNKVLFFAPDGTLKNEVPVKAGPLGLAWTPDSRALFAAGDNGQIYRINNANGTWKMESQFPAVDPAKGAGVFTAVDASAFEPSTPPSPSPQASTPQALATRGGNVQVAGLAISPDGRRLYAALGISNTVSVLDLANNNRTLAVVRTGIAPYRLIVSPDGSTLYVANRGGRAPLPGEASAPSAGTSVRVDPRTDAALRGSLSIINTVTFGVAEVDAGRQPADLKFSPDGSTLYVANSDEDTVAFWDVRTRRVRRLISLRPPLDPGFGQIPTSLALSGDGKTLYVACGGGNAVAAVSLPNGRISGYLPTGWYPIAIAEKAGRLFVASSKGYGSRVVRPNGGMNVNSTVGTVQFIEPAQHRQIAAHTRRVALNNRWGLAELPARRNMQPVPIPERAGEPSVFKHVVFIIKENHTYDSMMGDI
ncbi:MAG: hypothetical protein JWN98_1356, partial [Abditibacteriota bacterium]|nr:hypothetical protein [Abditibacteriota bacterium]